MPHLCDFKAIAMKAMTDMRTLLKDTITSAGQFLLSIAESSRELGPWCDAEVNRHIEEIVLHQFPGHCIITEELGNSHDETSEIVWIVDPIDGSVNFYRGLRQYSISICIRVQGELLLGAVYEPYANRLFIGEKRKGAELNGDRIRVSAVAGTEDVIIALSRCSTFSQASPEYRTKFLKIAQSFDVRISASTALDMCNVACGSLDARVLADTRVWDNAAAALIVRESGGIVTDWAGEIPTAGTTQVLASNGHIHAMLLDFLARSGQ